jgi:hypothetical protein
MNINFDIFKNGWFQRLVETSVVAVVLVLVLVFTMPKAMDENREALLRVQESQAKMFTATMEKISQTTLETARIQQDTLKSAIQQMRDDEREDRRLFVEILKRSDIGPEELQAAIEAATTGGNGT